MFYEARGEDGGRRIGCASSADGRSWARGEQALLEASEAGWDAGGVGAPCALPVDGGWRLYYEGYGRGGEAPRGVGMAVSGLSTAGGEPRGFARAEVSMI
jgi:hypothetical protein